MAFELTEKKWECAALILSVSLQVLMGYFLGHYYDMRVFMASGYATSSGLNPYVHHDFGNIFQHPLLMGNVPAIGYPPPWTLTLGIIYQLSYNLTNNILVYNLAIKIPIITSNIMLAYAVKLILSKLNVEKEKIQFAWLFILFNPFLILTTSAWGQIDTIVALLSLTSLYFLHRNKLYKSATMLAISVCLKPISLPLILIPSVYLHKNKKQIFSYYFIFASIFLFAYIFPFFLFNWNSQTALTNWDAHFEVAGAMSPFNLIEIFENSFLIPKPLNILGFLWIPALFFAYYVVRRSPPHNLLQLIESSLFLILVFFLTRAWLSEPNINLILPLMLILTSKYTSFRATLLHLIWIIPLIFMIFNTSFHQLFYPINVDILSVIATFDQKYRIIRLSARFLVAVVWQLLGWKIVLKTIKLKTEKRQTGTKIQL